MMKAKMGNTMIIGLSDENLRRLKEGQPVKYNMSVLGFPNIDVLIFNGKTEESMKTMLKDFIDPMKTIIIDDNAPNN